MNLDESQKQEVFEAFVSSARDGRRMINKLLKESGVTNSVQRREESNQWKTRLTAEFAQNGSYLKSYLEKNSSSPKEGEDTILMNKDGKTLIQPSISQLKTQDQKTEEMVERMPEGFKESFGDDTNMMLSQILVEFGEAKTPKSSGYLQLATKIRNNFRVNGRVLSSEVIGRMFNEGKGIPEKYDITLAMGKGKKFQDNKAKLLPLLQTVSSEYEQAVRPFMRKLDETAGMSDKKELFTFSAGTISGDKNLRYTEDRKDVYRYWGDINDKYGDFQDALDDVIALDMDSLSSLKEYAGKDLNYVYEFDKEDSEVRFPSQISRVFSSLDKVVDDLEDLQRVDRRNIETDQGFSGRGTDQQIRTDAERTGIGFEENPEMESEMAEFAELQEAVEDSREQLSKVDPLYKYIVEKVDLFDDPVMLEDEISEFRRAFKKGITYLYDLDFDETIIDYLEELSKTASNAPEGNLYLPMNDVLSSLASRHDAGEIDQRKKLIAKFLDTVAKVVMVEEPTGSIRDALANLAPFEGVPGNIPSRAKAKFDELVKQISEFFFIPLTSSHYPFADKLDFRTDIDSNTERLFAIITSKNSDITENAYLSIINQELQDAAFIDISIVEEIAELLEEATSPDAKSNIDAFKTKLEQLHAFLIPEVFSVSPDSTIGEEGKEELGDYFKSTLELNDVSLDDVVIFDEPAEDWEGGDVGPVRSVISHIIRREDSYRALDDAESISAFGTAIDRLKAAQTSMNVIKSDVELDLLQAHDSIRKMLGKPVYYNTSKLDNFEHVNTAMTVLKRDYNLDVSAIEVENIVSDFGSMDDIATKHGVSPESVYFLKGNFR